MYLPKKIENAEVLISVKTYPVPSDKYDELVCNAGFLKNGKWIRIYPIKFRSLPYDQQYSKFNWIRLNLTRRKRDFRPETYQPIQGIDEPIHVIRKVGTKNQWLERKRFALKEVFTSMSELISLAKTENRWKSLATLKPKEIVKFEIEPDERDWDQKMKAKLRQLQLFEKSDIDREARIVRKLPYKYYYHFLAEGDERPRRMMIEDWEIGALYWNCRDNCI